MRRDIEVTQREHPISADATLMSTTDVKGRIRYANAAFVAASGFERQELLSKAHNIVRHPDMPPEAFADLWRTLQQGLSWTAIVKNRCKNGDHYWVRANVTPLRRNGQLSGYMSVRTGAARAEIETAEKLYAAVREGRAKGWRFHCGIAVRSGALSWLSALQVMPVRWRIRSALGLMWAAGAAALGVQGSGPTLVASTGALGLAALAACAFLESQISRPLKQVLDQALSVAAGQDAQPVPCCSQRVDEIGMINRAITQSGLNVRALLDDVSERMADLAAASGDLAQGNLDLSRRTEEAAANLERTASSMEQMVAGLAQNADATRQAVQLSEASASSAEEGGKVVLAVVDTMQRIASDSGRIAEIVSVIDGIAFQTNLLALNAAVEAARAGDQGRGFAVVANEVRMLAKRSADAARQIKALIDGSTAQVQAGTALVGDAGQKMQAIVLRIQEVSGLIEGISVATAEQNQGSAQINSAVNHLDQMTQQNAALVEEAGAAAASMKEQTDRLVDAVAAFRMAA